MKGVVVTQHFHGPVGVVQSAFDADRIFRRIEDELRKVSESKPSMGLGDALEAVNRVKREWVSEALDRLKTEAKK